MKSLLLGLLAETSLHPGAGSAGGLVDLPVAREAATDYPCIPGSSLKGALRQWAIEANLEEDARTDLFGKQENAGQILISDARLLLLPIRSLDSSYKWTTCPHLLERFQRDAARAGVPYPVLRVSVARGEYLGEVVPDNLPLFLEERQFVHSDGAIGELATKMERLLPDGDAHSDTRRRLPTQLVVLNDDDFVWFARNGLPVNARNRLDNDTKMSRNLWYEESLPPDSVFYAIVAERLNGSLEKLKPLLDFHRYLQVGGNETIGMGWFALQPVAGKP